jgi:hypothetical protein
MSISHPPFPEGTIEGPAAFRALVQNFFKEAAVVQFADAQVPGGVRAGEGMFPLSHLFGGERDDSPLTWSIFNFHGMKAGPLRDVLLRHKWAWEEKERAKKEKEEEIEDEEEERGARKAKGEVK